MKVLLCGHRSFAARGLLAALRNAGHDVTCFSRGPLGRQGNVVTGPIDGIAENPCLTGPFDTVVNYILLKDEPPAANVAFVERLIRLCTDAGVRHLVHLSSISSYAASVTHVTEDAPTEEVPERKGPYGSLKVATDHAILKGLPQGMKLSLVRPGFVLGPGLVNPIVGTAARLPWNRLLLIGNARSTIPIVARDTVNEAIVRLVGDPPEAPREVVLLAAPNSPTRRDFLDACCSRLGAGRGVTTLPVPAWYVIAVGAECAARVLGQGQMKPYSKLVGRLPNQTFDATRSAERLKMDLATDWPSLLTRSMDAQDPAIPIPQPPAGPIRLTAGRVSFIGFGRIVRQKHLPSLRKHGFAGEICAYDLHPADDVDGVPVRALTSTNRPFDSDLTIVATPGPAHVDAIEHLASAGGPVLVEKPLAYQPEDLAAWLRFAAARDAPVFVCHNYRYKENVLRMMAHLRAYNPGRLRHVTLSFRSPPVANDSATWLRNERRARTLLMDYALHFVDIACMFGAEPWRVDTARHELNQNGETSVIEAHLSGTYSVNLLLRQGFGPRATRVTFEFENHTTNLGFFPDTFTAKMADDNPWQYKEEARSSRKATVRKVLDKLTSRDADQSHARVIAGAAQADGTGIADLRVERLAPFYEVLFDLAERVYGDGSNDDSHRSRSTSPTTADVSVSPTADERPVVAVDPEAGEAAAARSGQARG
jgi:predicted dehydrogenase/nucleoside-diphosphate-sugar epimerase